MRMRITARTDVGGRAGQQDSFGWVQMQRPDGCMGSCCILADGMGGMEGGAVASGLAVSEALPHISRSLLAPTDHQWRDNRLARVHIAAAIEDVRAAMAHLAVAEPRMADMGTTLSILLNTTWSTLIAHCGDTRVFAYNGTLTLLTRDHTPAWQLVESGIVKPSELRYVEGRNLLVHHVGTQDGFFDLSVIPATADTGFLMATDGFWEAFDFAELSQLLATLRVLDETTDIESAADALMGVCRDRAPADNATFVLAVPCRSVATDAVPYPLPAGTSLPGFRNQQGGKGP